MYRKIVFLSAALVVSTLATECLAQSNVVWGLNGTRTEWRDDAGLQANQGAKSGFFQTVNPVNYPLGSSGWWHLLDVRSDNPSEIYAMQIAGSFWDQNLFFRKTTYNPLAAWSRIVSEDPYGKAGVGRLLTRSIAFVDNDKFTHNGHSINHYGLEWNDDSWLVGGPTAWLSGYGGIKQFTAGQCRLAITHGGNVGIGTTSPPERLSVEGTIAARRVKVTQAAWPDYVFEPSYLLRPLDSLEMFIRTHKHLPDVVPAAVVEKDGVDLGENQAALLKKVEELTLYILQLRKEQAQHIEALEKRILSLEASPATAFTSRP